VTCHVCGTSCRKFGSYGRAKIQRYRCNVCRKTFSDLKPESPIGEMRIPFEKAGQAIACLLEGCSIRSVERLVNLNRNTIMRLLLIAGVRSARLMDAKMRRLKLKYLQLDEIWTFVQKKKRNRRSDDPPEFGDAWVFVALDEETKLIPAFFVGKRIKADTNMFLWDLYNRLDGRTQITTDGLHHYEEGVPVSFGLDVDFAQLIKLFDHGQFDSPEGRYSPSPIAEVISKVRLGDPDPDHISTSFVERSNLTMRQQMRRFTRLTLGFSKRLSHLKAAVALHLGFYNFCRVHSTLRVTPAMEAGLTDHIWSIRELLEAGA